MRGGALNASTVLARRGRDVAVFDTGMGHHTASLVAALAVEGLRPEDVTLVFNTHGHIDHSHNNAIFTRSRVFCSRRDRDWTLGMHAALSRTGTPAGADVVDFYPELASGAYDPKTVRKVLSIEKLLWDESRWGPAARCAWLEDLEPPPGIRVLPTPGHTPFHLSFAIDAGSSQVLVCGDALLVRNEDDTALPPMPQWSLERYRQSKAEIRRFNGIIVPGHDEPFVNDARD